MFCSFAQPADPWFCATCREPPAAKPLESEVEVEVESVAVVETPVPTSEWEEVYEKMKLDTANATS
jgi:hypothetical protein